MVNSGQNQSSGYQKAINPDEYVDMTLKNVILYNSRVAEKEVVDLAKVRDMLVYLVNQAENVCIGAGYINRKTKKLNMDDLDENEQKLYAAAVEYFKSKENIFGINIERMAARLLEEAVDGEYDSKVRFMREKLLNSVKENEIDSKTMDSQLANYKFQLMIDAVQSTKSRRVDFNV